MLANALSLSRTKSLIVAQSLTDVQSYGPGGMQGHDWCFNVVGDGVFTVDTDRAKLAPVLSKMVEKRKQRAKEAGTEREWRGHGVHGWGSRLRIRVDVRDGRGEAEEGLAANGPPAAQKLH